MKPICFANTKKDELSEAIHERQQIINSLNHVDFSTKERQAIQLLNRTTCTEHCRSMRVHEHLMKSSHCE